MAPKFTNVKSLQVKINAIGKNTQSLVGNAVQQGAQAIADNAAMRIRNPPKTGRIYPSRRHKGMHQASAPGEAPARDTGDLDSSINAHPIERGPDRFVSQAGSTQPYATVLELGGAKVAPRPFMSPAFEEEKPKAIKRIEAAIIKGARSK